MWAKECMKNEVRLADVQTSFQLSDVLFFVKTRSNEFATPRSGHESPPSARPCRRAGMAQTFTRYNSPAGNAETEHLMRTLTETLL